MHFFMESFGEGVGCVYQNWKQIFGVLINKYLSLGPLAYEKINTKAKGILSTGKIW